jgi:hypothetical protein
MNNSRKCSWRADVNSFPPLDGQTAFGPTYVYEYNTRQTYGQNISGWGPNDPLNATWWHLVTERASAACSIPRFLSDLCFRFSEMEKNPNLVTVRQFSVSVILPI